MSAENSADHGAEGGGSDLRARYLPVSRKELRRRREEDLATQREAQEQAEAAADELAERSDVQESGDETPTQEAGTADGPEERHSATDLSADQSVEEQSAESDHFASEDTEQGRGTPVSGESEHPSTALSPEDPDTQLIPTIPADAPHPPDEVEDGGAEADASEEDLAESAELNDAAHEHVPEPPTEFVGSTIAGSPEVLAEESDEPDEDVPRDSLGTDDAAKEPDGDDDETVSNSGFAPEFSDELADQDDEDAPVPASRRARRLLRETGRLEALTDERLSEIDEITRQAAAVSAEDPNKVDPELLKKQQALAAKAMQENQERRRREQEEAQREQRIRRRQRPESEVITRKALRAYAEADEEYRDVATGEIDPVEASGAHGLELDELVEHTSRQASRQSLMLWMVIVLAVLLVIAVGVVLYFVL